MKNLVMSQLSIISPRTGKVTGEQALARVQDNVFMNNTEHCAIGSLVPLQISVAFKRHGHRVCPAKGVLLKHLCTCARLNIKEIGSGRS